MENKSATSEMRKDNNEKVERKERQTYKKGK